MWLGFVGFLQSVSYIKPILTQEKLFAVGTSGRNATFKLIFLGLGWPWVGGFVGFTILLICFPTQHNLVHCKPPTVLRIFGAIFFRYCTTSCGCPAFAFSFLSFHCPAYLRNDILRYCTTAVPGAARSCGQSSAGSILRPLYIALLYLRRIFGMISSFTDIANKSSTTPGRQQANRCS